MDATTHLPLPRAPQSYWQHDGQKNDSVPEQGDSAPRLSASCDVAIVGAGYAGIATAYHLLKSTSPPPSVVLLEAREPCSGATGRNGGHLRPDYLVAAASNSKRHPAAAAAEISRFEARHLDAIKSLIQSEGIECDFAESRSFAVLTTSEQVSSVRGMYDELRGASDFDRAVLDHVEFYAGDDAPRRTGVSEAKGYFSTPAAQLSPYKLCTALLARCVDMGLIVKAHTAVASLQQSGPSGQTLKTHLGETVTARKTVLATNAYMSALLPEYAPAIVPCKGVVCHITGPEGKALPRLPAKSLIIMEQDPVSHATGYNYLVQRADNSVIVGGAHHKYDGNELGSWYSNIDDTELIEPAKQYFEGDYAQKTFVGWEDSQARASRVWAGIMGYSADSLPHVGEVPGRDGVFVLAGFNGHGMPVIYLTARGIADMVGQDASYEQTGLPTLFETTQERLESKRNDILAGRGIRPAAK